MYTSNKVKRRVMEKFNIGTLKFVVMIVAICLLFFLLVNNAYNYLPKEDTIDDIPYNDSYSQETVSYSSSKKESSNNNEENNTDNTESKQVAEEFDKDADPAEFYDNYLTFVQYRNRYIISIQTGEGNEEYTVVKGKIAEGKLCTVFFCNFQKLRKWSVISAKNNTWNIVT